jgi:DNA-binding PucR family transcriptional regulator
MIEHATNDCYTVIYNNLIVILIGNNENETGENLLKKMTKFEAAIIKENIYCGISDSFENLIGLKKAYDQALKALELGSRLKESSHIYQYKDFAIYYMLELIAEKRHIADFCNPLVSSLIEYDNKNSSVYAETLSAYLNCGRNAKKTADILHIHRNTMSYRLKKIEELTGIDWDDGNLLTAVILSFGIQKLLKIKYTVKLK